MIELQKNRIFFSFLFRFLRSILGTEKKRNKNENGGDTFSAVAVAFADELDIIFVSIWLKFIQVQLCNSKTQLKNRKSR